MIGLAWGKRGVLAEPRFFHPGVVVNVDSYTKISSFSLTSTKINAYTDQVQISKVLGFKLHAA